MDKMRMESLDMTAQNIEKIGALFPNCVTETIDENGKPKKAINFELLKQMLYNNMVQAVEHESLQDAVERDGEVLQAKIRKEKQLNVQMKLNSELKKLKKELEVF